MHKKARLRNSTLNITWPAAMAALATAILFALAVALTPAAQAQAYQVLYAFTAGADGGYPYAGLTMDRGGNLYGTAQGGGKGFGTVFKLTHRGSGWVLNPLYSFRGVSNGDGDGPLARVVFGPDGSLYATTSGGGAPGCNYRGTEGCGTVFNLKPPRAACKTALCPWTETVLYRFTGGSDGANPQNGALLIAPSGVIYGTTEYGGAYGYGVVFSLTPSQGGWTYNIIHSFTGGADGRGPYSGVIFDNAGNLYGTTCGGGSSGYGAVYELLPSGSGWQEKVLYSFTGSLQDGYGVCPEGGLIFDGSGNLYGTSEMNFSPYGGGNVFELTPSNGSWMIAHGADICGGGNYAGAPVDSLVMDAAGNLYGTLPSCGSYPTGTIFKISPDWTTVTDLYGWWPPPAYVYGGPILDANGNLYGTTADTGANNAGVVSEITP